MSQTGLVQIYTGDGKGKTTAAFGLALRAAGQGMKVLVYQFLKPPALNTGERIAVQAGQPDIKIEALDIPWDMDKSFDDRELVARTANKIRDVLENIAQYAQQKTFDVLILDEIVFCLSKGLVELEDIKNIIDKRDSSVEIVLTGRGATDQLIELADLVTEMKKIKHPFDKDVSPRRGIEF